MNPCILCGNPTQTPERMHTPCFYAYLFPRPRFGNEIAQRVRSAH